MAGKAGHRAFGRIRKLPSKRFQASYVGPDGLRHVAPGTFTTKQDAEGWLASEDRLTSSPDWRSPAARAVAARAAHMTLTDYADTWLRQRPLKPRTVALYRDLLDRRILPPLGALHVDQLTPALPGLVFTPGPEQAAATGARLRIAPHHLYDGGD